MNDNHASPKLESNTRKYEQEQINVWLIVLSALGLLALTVFAAVAVSSFNQWAKASQQERSIAEARYEPAAEGSKYQHWINPPSDLQALRERDAQRLREYAWVDREDGIVRIPIERAMALLVAERSADNEH